MTACFMVDVYVAELWMGKSDGRDHWARSTNLMLSRLSQARRRVQLGSCERMRVDCRWFVWRCWVETGRSQRESEGCCRQGRGEQKAAEGEVSGSEGAGRHASGTCG